MDSSPDLSLKLRRGSNDSRDSYYMDFAQGIDSDIEEVATVAAAPGNVDMGSDSSDSQAPVCLPANDLDSDERVEPDLVIDESSLLPQPPLDAIASIPAIPAGIRASTITNITDNSTTDEDDDLSQITPLPMPILPSLKTDNLQMLPPKIPLVEDEEG